MFFSILLVICTVKLRQHLAAAAPGSLDHHRGLSASTRSRVIGDGLWPCHAGHRALPRHRGIKLTASTREASHIQGPLK